MLKMQTKWLGILIAVMLATGCRTNGVEIDSYCLIAKPIMISKSQDVLSDETAEMILEHNEQWELLCD